MCTLSWIVLVRPIEHVLWRWMVMHNISFHFQQNTSYFQFMNYYKTISHYQLCTLYIFTRHPNLNTQANHYLITRHLVARKRKTTLTEADPFMKVGVVWPSMEETKLVAYTTYFGQDPHYYLFNPKIWSTNKWSSK